MRITQPILSLISGLAILVVVGAYGNVAVAGENFEELVAQAEQEVKAAKEVGHEWKLIPNDGGRSASLTKLLESAKKAHAAGETEDAIKTTKRVIEAAKLGQQQAAEQQNAAPNYN
ncbi:MAG: hypothetical protein OEQ18_03580 [Gammaproteobacteria bacterium]|nr:hypothetical protein [Gammaproteobacteria bacterium]